MGLPRVCILGSLEVHRDGHPVSVGGARARRILALLVARAGRPIRIDELADTAWDGAPPASWRNTLQTYFSRFRASSGIEIARHADAYGIDVDTCTIDGDEFTHLRETASAASRGGRWTDAQHHLTAALDLWRGEAFDGFTDLETIRPAAVALTEQRLDAVESLVEAYLATESLNDAIVASDVAWAGTVAGERLTCLRATALNRCGRSAEALRALSGFRRQLVDDTGLDPTPALATLEQAILQQTAAIDADAEPPSPQLPVELERSRTTPLIGRRQQLSAALRAWDIAASGGCGALFLVGEAGVGKTRLAAEIAAAVLDHEGAVRYGRATERLETPHRVFAHALRDVSSDVLDTVGALRPELFAVVPHLLPRGLAGNDADDIVHPTRFHEALDRLLTAVAAKQPLALVLDDLQWAAASTIAAIEHLVTVGRPGGLLVLATARTDEPGAPTTALDLANDLARRDHATVLDVGGLDEEAVAELFAARDLPLDDPLTRHVFQATGGNALLATELAASVEVVDDLWRSTGMARLDVPATVVALVDDRIRRLSDGGETLGWAALIGIEFELAVVEQASGDPATLDRLEEAARAGLTREVVSGTWAFCHGLTRDAMLQRLSRSRTARRHAEIAAALDVLRPTDDLLGRIAHHWCEAGNAGDPTTAIDRSIDAARLRLRQRSPEAARRLVRRALELADVGPSPAPETLAMLYLLDARACELSLDQAGRTASADRAFAHAVQATDEQQRPGLVADAALMRNSFWTQGRLDRVAVGCIETALEITADEATRIHLLASLAGMLAVSGAPPNVTGHDPIELAETALAIADGLDDPTPWLSAATSLIVTLFARPAAARQLALADEIAKRAGDRGPLIAARWRAAPALALGDRPTFEAAAASLRAIDEDAGFDALRAFGFQCGCLSALLDGRFADAAVAGANAVELARGHPNFARVQVAQSFWIASETDTLEAIVPTARQVVADNTELPVFHAMVGLVLAATDRLDEVPAILERLGIEGFATIPRDVLWTATIAACAELTAATGSAEYVEPLQHLLDPYGGQFVVVAGGAFVYGAVDRFLALLAATAGDDDRAAELFTSAATAERNVASAALEARTHVWRLRTIGDHTGATRRRLEELCASHELPWASHAAATLDQLPVIDATLG